MRKLTAVLIGAGNRGTTYTDKMFDMPEMFQVIGVAEPVESRRNYIKEKHGIKDEMCFDGYESFFNLKEKVADFVIISTMDQLHFEPAMQAIRLGYDILLEKPVSPNPQECKIISEEANKYGVKVLVCHVLRYTAFFNTIKDLIDDGKIGEVSSIHHEECVGNVHMSHSFVRGNWGNSERSSCMLLQKCCHDMDILQWLLGKNCVKVQSFGSLTHFTEKYAPKDAPDYCIEGCPHADTCYYNAVKLYYDDKENEWFRTTSTKQANPTDEMVEQALRTTQYGKCVYKCDNDVVDHQTVNLLFEDGVTVSFSMNPFNKGGRYIHIMGTKGEIRACMAEDENPIEIYEFATKQTTEIPMKAMDGILGGHGGGDEGIVRTLYEYLLGTYTGKSACDISQSSANHLIVFAAEESRLNGTVVDLNEYVKNL